MNSNWDFYHEGHEVHEEKKIFLQDLQDMVREDLA